MFEGKKERLVVLVCIILATLSLVVNTIVGCIQRDRIMWSLDNISDDFGYGGEFKKMNENLDRIRDKIPYGY